MGKSLEVFTQDVTKGLLDYKYHPSTVYFPLIVNEAIIVESTETEIFKNIE